MGGNSTPKNGGVPGNAGNTVPAVPGRSPSCSRGVPASVPAVVPSVPALARSNSARREHGPGGVRRNPFTFHPTTCPHCRAGVLAGTTVDGLAEQLEPWPVDNYGEVAALTDGVPTFNLYPDMTARRRGVSDITHAHHVTHPRQTHALHVCGTTYASPPPPPPAAPRPTPTDAPPF